MVAGLSRKYDRADYQYQVRNGLSKGVMLGSKTGRHQGGLDNPRPIHSVSCLPERRYIALPQLFSSEEDSVYSGVSELSDPVRQQTDSVSRILESFNCLCLGGETSRDLSSQRRRKVHRRRLSSPGIQPARIVYPIASYPGRLNSKRLVEQRRQSLQHHFFRPVQTKIYES